MNIHTSCERCGLRAVRHELEQNGVIVHFCNDCYWREVEQANVCKTDESFEPPRTPCQGSMLKIKLDRLSDFSVLTVQGEIDLGNVHALEHALNQLDDALPLLLDFAGVRYMDSRVVHLLFRTCDRYDTKKTPVALVADDSIKRICTLAGLQERVFIFVDAVVARRNFPVPQPYAPKEVAMN